MAPPIETLATGFGLIEGPCADAAGNLYWSDVPGGGVYRMSPDREITTAIPKRRGVGGIALHADGGLVVSGRNICHVKDGGTRIIFERPDIPGFNDIATDANGRVLAGSVRSDPFSEGARTPGELYRLGPDGAVEELYGEVGLTNGIGFSPDGSRMYHSDSSARHVLVSTVGANGEVSGTRPLFKPVQGVPDGLAVDEEGSIWVALYGAGAVASFNAAGEQGPTVAVPATAVTSVCFGVADPHELYIVTADNTDEPDHKGTVFRTRADVPGLVPPLARI